MWLTFSKVNGVSPAFMLCDNFSKWSSSIDVNTNEAIKNTQAASQNPIIFDLELFFRYS